MTNTRKVTLKAVNDIAAKVDTEAFTSFEDALFFGQANVGAAMKANAIFL
jgi:hypothetical protein